MQKPATQQDRDGRIWTISVTRETRKPTAKRTIRWTARCGDSEKTGLSTNLEAAAYRARRVVRGLTEQTAQRSEANLGAPLLGLMLLTLVALLLSLDRAVESARIVEQAA